jgi:protein translocase SecG subunit
MTYLPYIQIVLSIILIAGILLQRSEASLGSSFGADSAAGGRFMRRGLERILFHGTLIIAVLFAASAIAPLFIGR